MSAPESADLDNAGVPATYAGYMKTLLCLILVAGLARLAPAQAPASAKIESLVENSAAIGKIIEGWGSPIDPDGDCTFDLQDGALVITVPGGPPPHDLSAEIGSSNSPRVLHEVTGDFILQVRVDGDFNPGEKSTQPGRTGYTGAGLVLFADAKNYVRLERATLQRAGGPRHNYGNFEVRLNGQLQRIGITSDLPLEDNQPVYLQLERRGSTVLGAISHDGKKWKEGVPKEIGADWPPTLLAGVAAISTSVDVFTPFFSDIRTTNNPKSALEK